jgi:hypothetical protein
MTIGGSVNFTNGKRALICWFQFALTVDPKEVNVGHLNVEPTKFPSKRTYTVFVRALLTRAANLHGSISKVILGTTPSTLPALYLAQGDEFEPALKTTYDASLDPAKVRVELKKLRVETEFEYQDQRWHSTYPGGRNDGRSHQWEQ